MHSPGTEDKLRAELGWQQLLKILKPRHFGNPQGWHRRAATSSKLWLPKQELVSSYINMVRDCGWFSHDSACLVFVINDIADVLV